MNRWFALVLGVALVTAGGCGRAVDPEGEKPKIKAVVDQFGQVWETKDLELFSRIMAHDRDMVNFGTDANEHFVGWQALKDSVEKIVASIESMKFVVNDQMITVDPSGTVAWFSEFVDWDGVVGGQPFHMAGTRLTGVLEKRGGGWVIVQFHASVPHSG